MTNRINSVSVEANGQKGYMEKLNETTKDRLDVLLDNVSQMADQIAALSEVLTELAEGQEEILEKLANFKLKK